MWNLKKNMWLKKKICSQKPTGILNKMSHSHWSNFWYSRTPLKWLNLIWGKRAHLYILLVHSGKRAEATGKRSGIGFSLTNLSWKPAIWSHEDHLCMPKGILGREQKSPWLAMKLNFGWHIQSGKSTVTDFTFNVCSQMPTLLTKRNRGKTLSYTCCTM